MAEQALESVPAGVVRTLPVAAGDIAALAAELAGDPRLEFLYGLPLKLSGAKTGRELAEHLAQAVLHLIPGALRTLVAVREEDGSLTLLSTHPDDLPAVSESLAGWVIDHAQAVLWRREGQTTRSQDDIGVIAAVYAPIADADRSYGVLCVDSPLPASSFQPEDLLLAAVAAQFAAVGLKRLETEERLRSNVQILERILPSFSPAVRTVLVERAKAGKLYPRYERSEVTLLYSDIRGFTNLSRRMADHDLFDLLNECFSVQSAIILSYGGTIDNFEGDGLLAVFGSPAPDPDHRLHAVLAALDIQEAIAGRNSAAGRKLPPLELGIGVHSGRLLHGFVGDADRLQFTVIGEAANVGSRYAAAAPAGQVLISEDVFAKVWKHVKTEKLTIETKHEGPLEARRVISVSVEARSRGEARRQT